MEQRVMKFIKMLPLAFALAGCGTINTIPVIGPAISGVITAPTVAVAVTNLCKFVPQVADVAAVIAANPLVTTIDAYANMICTGLSVSGRYAARRGAGAPAVSVVNGVTVRGHF